MADERKRRRSLRIGLALLVVYPLSFGPFAYLWSHDKISDQTYTHYVLPLYWPLVLIERNIPLLGDLFTRYMSWWYNLP